MNLSIGEQANDVVRTALMPEGVEHQDLPEDDEDGARCENRFDAGRR